MICAPGFISPLNDGLSGCDRGRGLLCSSGEIDDDENKEKSAEVEIPESSDVEDPVEPVVGEEVRHNRLAHHPWRPTKKEIAEHNVTHCPSKSWCRHCVRGRAVGSPHLAKTDEEREFAKGRFLR